MNAATREPTRIVLIDDDEDVHERIRRLFRVPYYDVRCLASPMGTTNVIRAFAPQVVILDLNLPAISGEQLFSVIREKISPSPRVVLFSNHSPDHIYREARRLGADGWASKGDPLHLEKIIEDLTGRRALRSRPSTGSFPVARTSDEPPPSGRVTTKPPRIE